jgi:hypothetical protein
LAASICSAVLLVACASGSQTGQRAAEGATAGAVSGAVGGLVTALVFGGDPVERAARGAVYGGAVGATAGAMSGAAADKRAAQAREEELGEVRERIGPDAFAGLEALAECRHSVAVEQGRAAQSAQNPNYALAGLWLEVLTLADARDEAGARALFPRIVETDWDIKSTSEAEGAMRNALRELMDIRAEYGLPRVCGE